MAAEEPQLLAIGERAALGPLRADLAATYARWLNDPEVKQGLPNLGVLTPEAEADWIAAASRESAKPLPAQANFTVYAQADLAPVGVAGLKDIDHRNRTAELGIFLGVRRGEGLGTDAVRLVLDWAFGVLSLHSVWLAAAGWNDGAIRAYERAGFRMVGRRRDAMLSRGRLHDQVLMDALATDFRGSR